MIFANPAALWGLLFLLLPIAVHLFSFRTSKRVLFSNISFLQEVKQESRRKQQLKHLLLLALRMLAIVAAVLAFARPQFGEQVDKILTGAAYHSVFIDNSPSMSLPGEEGVILEQAKQAARSIARQARPDDRFQLITHELLPVSQRWLSKDDFLSQLDAVNQSSRTNPITLIFERQKDLIVNQGDPEKTWVYWLSDFQASAFDLQQLTSTSGLNVRFMQMQAFESPNLYIDSCWLAQPLLRPGETARLIYRVKNGGAKAAEAVRIALRVNDTQRGMANIDLPAFATAVDTIDFTLGQAGDFRAVLSLDDRFFPYDDAWYMQLEVKEKLAALHLYDKKPNVFVRALFAEDDFIALQSETIAQLDYNSISGYSAIILDGLNDARSGLVDALANAVQQGASLVFLPATDASQPGLQRLFDAMGGGTLGKEMDDHQAVVALNLDDPLYQETFSNIPEQLSLPAVYKRVSFEPTPQDRVLMRLANGAPLLLRRTFGHGQVIVLLSPLDLAYTDLPQHALFVPTMYRSVLLGAGIRPLSYRIGAQEVIAFKTNGQPLTGLIGLQSSRLSYIPEVRREGGTLYLNLRTGELEPGHYVVIHDQAEVAGMRLALNGDAAESALKTWSPEDLAAWATAQGWEHYAVAKADLAGALHEVSKDGSLWRWILLLLLVFLLLEGLVIKFVK
jgi:hypothetical protein